MTPNTRARASPASAPLGQGQTAAACVCGIVGGLLRHALAVAALLGVVAGAAELALRAAGVQARAPVTLSGVVPDGWTGFRLQPGVSGQEAFVTNDLGMHAPRSYARTPPPGTLRVAVLGSSVVYGLNVPFADTIPMAVERQLQAVGFRAEVLNFGTHGFTIVNLSALLQAYVHQLQPDVVVVVIDLQIGLPRWPAVRPAQAATDGTIEKLGFWEALLKRGSARSAVLALLDDPRPARRFIRRATGLALGPRPPPPAQEAATTPPVPVAIAIPGGTPPESLSAYEARRERELRAPLAAMAAFAAEKSMTLYFVTPYGPYFDLTDDELERMSVHHFLEEAARIHGSERLALGAEVELVTRVTHRVATRHGARVIDMLAASRSASPRASPDFGEDGVHLTPAGNAAFGRLIAMRILQDLPRRAGGPD